MELKNDRANIAADFLIQRKGLGAIIMEIFNNYVRLIVPDDSNRSRCSSHPLWERFVGAVGKCAFLWKGQKSRLWTRNTD